jgi:hypothetical protein
LALLLEHALRRARGGYLFPGPGGKRLSRHTDLPTILRRALVAAGVVDHWELVCRRKGCGHSEESPTPRSLPCPKCGFALWPVAVPPEYQFKDLRSTWATLAGEATGDIRFVQAGLGHSDPRVTERHYAAIRASHLLEQANKLWLGLEAPPPAAGTASGSPATAPRAPAPQGSPRRPPGRSGEPGGARDSAGTQQRVRRGKCRGPRDVRKSRVDGGL